MLLLYVLYKYKMLDVIRGQSEMDYWLTALPVGIELGIELRMLGLI